MKKSETVRRQESEASDSLVIKVSASTISENDQTLLLYSPISYLNFIFMYDKFYELHSQTRSP